MHTLIGIAGCLMVLSVLWEAFETVILPRRVRRRFRFTSLFYSVSWSIWRFPVRHRERGRKIEGYLSAYGPLSVLLLPVLWACILILGYAMVYWGLASPMAVNNGPGAGFGTDLYFSGTTFITLGLGEVTPSTALARATAVVEAGNGFGFLAIVITYLPVLYQSFSRRERDITLLDARAGSPPSGSELLRRHAKGQGLRTLEEMLRDWEHWAAELLEAQISYPVLSYFRSQHANQSWLATVTMMLDTCALIVAGIDGTPDWQARLTFAMARHAVVDMAQILNTPPEPPCPERLPAGEFARIQSTLAAAGLPLSEGAQERLAGLRHTYEPYVNSLAAYLLVSLPPWLPDGARVDNWRTSAWEHRRTGLPPSLFPE